MDPKIEQYKHFFINMKVKQFEESVEGCINNLVSNVVNQAGDEVSTKSNDTDGDSEGKGSSAQTIEGLSNVSTSEALNEVAKQFNIEENHSFDEDDLQTLVDQTTKEDIDELIKPLNRQPSAIINKNKLTQMVTLDTDIILPEKQIETLQLDLLIEPTKLLPQFETTQNPLLIDQIIEEKKLSKEDDDADLNTFNDSEEEEEEEVTNLNFNDIKVDDVNLDKVETSSMSKAQEEVIEEQIEEQPQKMEEQQESTQEQLSTSSNSSTNATQSVSLNADNADQGTKQTDPKPSNKKSSFNDLLKKIFKKKKVQ